MSEFLQNFPFEILCSLPTSALPTVDTWTQDSQAVRTTGNQMLGSIVNRHLWIGDMGSSVPRLVNGNKQQRNNAAERPYDDGIEKAIATTKPPDFQGI